MSKEIIFRYDAKLDRFEAQCIDIDNSSLLWGASKVLTNKEVDYLSEVVDFSQLMDEPGTNYRYSIDILKDVFDYGDAYETNFGLMYMDFVKETA